MRKVILAVAVLLMMSAAAGCATLPSQDKMAEETKGYNLPKQPDSSNTLIYVVRPHGYNDTFPFNIYLDGQERASRIGLTQGAQYIYFFVTPGRHTIYSKAEGTAEIVIDAKAGDTIFVRQDIGHGWVMPKNSMRLISDVEGKYYVKNGSLGEI
jgi:hypothetical protein